MKINVIASLQEIDRQEWNTLAGPDNPFIQHDFLSALEQHDCLQPYGWYPQHITVYEDDQLVAAMPLYIKDNSYGEFVFDWSWASAWQQHGLNYYPKLVCSIPYTPATGPRLLVKHGVDRNHYYKILVSAALQLAEQLQCSSSHWLFTNDKETDFFKNLSLPMRLGCQFHWHNHNYQSFDDFLQSLSSSKRKKIKRERRMVQEQDIQIEILNGHDMNESLWQTWHHFYCDTFNRKSGEPTLSLDFFQSLGTTMADNLAMVFAKHNNKYVACAFTLKGTHTLYGRHWGCIDNFHSLHFEACYYQGIEYCITHGLQHFEPGAQGEHKISRGFEPTATWSAHWIADTTFAESIKHFTQDEQRAMQQYIEACRDHSPYKSQKQHG